LRLAEANLLQETPVGDLVERFSKTVRGHVLGTNVLEYELAVVHLILNVMVVDINVFGALMVALTCDELEGGLVVTVELDRMDVFARVTDLPEEPLELRGFFCGVREADVLGFGG
jgi:hypothetical protein